MEGSFRELYDACTADTPEPLSPQDVAWCDIHASYTEDGYGLRQADILTELTLALWDEQWFMSQQTRKNSAERCESYARCVAADKHIKRLEKKLR